MVIMIFLFACIANAPTLHAADNSYSGKNVLAPLCNAYRFKSIIEELRQRLFTLDVEHIKKEDLQKYLVDYFEANKNDSHRFEEYNAFIKKDLNQKTKEALAKAIDQAIERVAKERAGV